MIAIYRKVVLTMLRQHPVLFALFILQAGCMLFLLVDVIADMSGLEASGALPENETLEYLVVFGLFASLVYSGAQIMQLLRRNKTVEDQLMAASGAFNELLQRHFADWRLTSSEADVALLAIKGLDIAEIASMRDTKEGTVKAQLNAIYRKAEVSGRPQLISLFIEELMSPGPL